MSHQCNESGEITDTWFIPDIARSSRNNEPFSYCNQIEYIRLSSVTNKCISERELQILRIDRYIGQAIIEIHLFGIE